MAGSSSRVRSSFVECSRSRRRATSQRRLSLACNELGRTTGSRFHASPLGRRGRRRRGARPRRAVSHLATPCSQSPRARLMPSTTGIIAHCVCSRGARSSREHHARSVDGAPWHFFLSYPHAFLPDSVLRSANAILTAPPYRRCTSATNKRANDDLRESGMLTDPGTRRAL